MSKPWFFLSYSRADSTGNAHLPEFYKDLTREVRRMAGLGSETKDTDIGFFDRSDIETGSSWRVRLSSALQTCRVLICLYSRGYFNSEYCGKEFQIFRSRIENSFRHSPAHLLRQPLIIPVLWDRQDRLPKPLPHVVSEIQYSDAELGENYAKEGLYFLMKVSKFRSEYEEVLLRLAGKVVRAGEADSLPRLSSLPTIGDVNSAFQDGESALPEAAAPTQSAFSRVAQFVYVAGSGDEMRSVRKNVACYGEQGGREWQPYHPEIPKSIGILSQGVATMESLQYETYPAASDIIEKIREAEEINSIVVIVVDPWSIQIESYKKYMLDFDEKDFLNCGILIPWNKKDDETSKNIDELRANVQGTFTRKFILNTYIKQSIYSMDELEREIYSTINEIRRRLLLKAKVQRPVGGGGAPIPIISSAVASA
jgi:FxsC-like protein